MTIGNCAGDGSGSGGDVSPGARFGIGRCVFWRPSVTGRSGRHVRGMRYRGDGGGRVRAVAVDRTRLRRASHGSWHPDRGIGARLDGQHRGLLDPVLLGNAVAKPQRGRQGTHVGGPEGGNLREVAHAAGNQCGCETLVDTADAGQRVGRRVGCLVPAFGGGRSWQPLVNGRVSRHQAAAGSACTGEQFDIVAGAFRRLGRACRLITAGARRCMTHFIAQLQSRARPGLVRNQTLDHGNGR